MNLAELTQNLPPARTVAEARAEIAKQLTESRTQLVVVDDDPTGTQTVHGVRVYMDWSHETLRQALTSGNTASFISANTRALKSDEVRELARTIGQHVREAARMENMNVVVASRSDSTLRGHFPCEVDSLLEGLEWDCDGIILAPGFFEAGRYTIDDVQWVASGDEVVPASETEFAKDPTFGYKNSSLPRWVEEKTQGAVRADQVRSIPLETTRTLGPEAVAAELMKASDKQPVVVNAACYEDLEVFMLGLLAAEARGKRFIYRCAAPFVKVRAGIQTRALLTSDEIGSADGPGLIVVGSYVGKTSRQLDSLIGAGLATGVELRAELLMDESRREPEIQRVAQWIDERMAARESVAVYTSRATVSSNDTHFLDIGSVIMSSLCRVVSSLSRRPGFLIAKGGITSMEVARLGLGIKGAAVLGQILDGVPVWRLGKEAKWTGIPYVVFPGNVGDDDALRDTVRALRGTE